MGINAFNGDVSIIQTLDDEPNDSGGLTAAQLKEKFDAAPNLIKHYINTALIPSITAGNIPFAPSANVPAYTVQAAVENVQAQVADVAFGVIPDGSVTQAKMAPDMKKNVRGGVAAYEKKTQTAAFMQAGVYTFIVPAGITGVDAWICGGGGGGGGYTATGSSQILGGGGGGYWRLYRDIPVTPGQSIPVTVGAGGLGGQQSGNASQSGLSGGYSQFLDENRRQYGGAGSVGTDGAQGGSGGGAYMSPGGFGGADGTSRYASSWYSGGLGGRCLPPYNPYDSEYYGSGGGAYNGTGGPHAGSGQGGSAEAGYGGGGSGGSRGSSASVPGGNGGCGCVKIYY